MAIRQHRVRGLKALNLMTELCQRARGADPGSGTWEAADFQWWWRKPRKSDNVDQIFWLDEHGPLAGVWLSEWGESTWQIDPVTVADAASPSISLVLQSGIDALLRYGPTMATIPVLNNDHALHDLVVTLGFASGESDSTAWLLPKDLPKPAPVPAGFVIADRTLRPHFPHPMRHRNGDEVGFRLAMCSLYDPELDLVAETEDGTVAGYSLYWFDPVTKVGLVEPVRVEDGFQRRGLARAMVIEGVRRLINHGATRVKVSYENGAAQLLYESVGFATTDTTTWYVKNVDSNAERISIH